MSTFRWIIIAGLLGMLVGTVCSDALYHHKNVNSVTIDATPDADVMTQRTPVETVSLAGLTIYEKSLIGTNSVDQTFEEYGWHPGLYGKYILPPLLMGAVFIGLLGIMIIIRWVNAHPNLNLESLQSS
jgi:hypothetical protein